MGYDFILHLTETLKANGGKIPLEFIDYHLNHGNTKVTHVQPTPNTRVCVITLPTGHDLVGYAQVLDSKNDVELIGQEVAYKNASEEIWAVFVKYPAQGWLCLYEDYRQPPFFPFSYSPLTSIAWKERIITMMTSFLKLICWKKPVSGKWDKKEITTDIKIILIGVAIVAVITLLAEVNC